VDLLCVGDVMLDVHVDTGALARGGDVHGRVRIHPGGTSANAAVWAAWDGAGSRVHGGVGRDLAGDLLAAALRDRGVKTHLTPYPDAPTGTMLVVRETGERSMVADRGANALFREDRLPGSLVCGALLVSGYLLLHEDTHAVAVAALERAVTPFAAVEAGSWPLVEAFGADRFFAATQRASVLLANDREAEALVGVAGEAAATRLGERYPLVCVKQGAEGVIAVADGRVHRVPGEPTVLHNATGAGDAFDGVLLGALARGAPLEDALLRACHAGALAVASDETWPVEGAA
jgi:sugar/nucleoside kinase (ribokinase family)